MSLTPRNGTTRGDPPKNDPPKSGPHAQPAPGTTSTIPPEQLVTPPTSPPHLGGKQVLVTLGPHAGSPLIMPEAEADQAIADKWAVEPTASHDPDAQPAAPLSPEDTASATEAANLWAAAQTDQPVAEPQKQKADHKPESPPQRGHAEAPAPAKGVTANEHPKGYETR